MNQYTPWTPEEDKILRENAHLTRAELAELLPDRSVSAILNRAQKKGWTLGGGYQTAWSGEELAILAENAHLPIEELQELLPGRTANSIRIKAYKSDVTLGYSPQDRRPLTDETAYQCRIEYAQKREYGYTHEQAVRWVADANERDINIVRDLLENPKYDAEVEECRRKTVRMTMTATVFPDADEVAEMLKLMTAGKSEWRDSMETPIVGTNIETGERIYFPSIKAADQAGFTYESISRCLRGRNRSHRGYTWERLKDYDY